MPFHSQLSRDQFERYLLEVAIATLDNGGTASRVGDYQLLPPIDAWQFPKYPARTIILAPHADLVEGLRDFILSNETYLSEPDCWLGTWINPQTQCVYLDITTSCHDLEAARNIALEISEREGRRIVALYNSSRRETVYL